MTLLEGRRNMPAFGGNGDMGLFFSVPTLNDEQIAAVINYVRSNFGNHFPGTNHRGGGQGAATAEHR